MTWTIDTHIGELRPWPESVDVVRGDETRRYVAEGENTKLRELVRDMHSLLVLSRDLPATVSGISLTEDRMRELGIEVDV